MNTDGRRQIGECGQDDLIAGNRHPLDVCHVTIKEGRKLYRGSLLEEDAEDPGKYVLRGTQEAEVQDTEPQGGGTKAVQDTPGDKGTAAEYILADDVDASMGDTVGLAYRTGEFAENALIVKEGYEITEEDRKELRKAGIFLTRIMM